MSAQARPRIKRHEAKRFGARGGDDVPDINVHGGINALEFVDEGDVDGAENIFEQLGGLGRPAIGHGNEVTDGAAIHLLRQRQTIRRETANDLGNVRYLALRVGGVFAFRRKGEMKIRAGAQAGTMFQHSAQFILGGAGIGSGFEHDQLPALKMGREAAAGGEHKGEIGRTVFPQRRGHANENGGGVLDLREISGGVELAGLDELLDVGGGNVPDIAAAGGEGGDFAAVNVQSEHAHSAARELQAQGQPHVTESYNGDVHAGSVSLPETGCRQKCFCMS